MKKITLLLVGLFIFLTSNAQIGIIDGLNSTTIPTGWTSTGSFGGTATTPCEGSHAWRKNFYEFSATGSFTTVNYPEASNGTDVTVSFQWKATEWDIDSGVGFTVNAEYSIDNGTTWTPIGSPMVATGITDCTTFSEIIPAASVPDGSDFKFRVNGTWTDGDCYFWIDNINITQVTALPPNCDATLISPADGSSDANLLGILSWSQGTGLPTGYVLSVGTVSGGTDVVNALDLGQTTTYNIPGILTGDTTYYVNITPYNPNGTATGCLEYSFTTGPAPEPGVLCENAIIVDALPYNVDDSTTNYADVYYENSPGATGCGTTSSYLNGNDVVYSYTAAITGTIDIVLTPAAGNTWGGLFVYGSCSDIGVACLGGVSSSAATPKSILEFPVTSGQTYYLVISTWASPQTIAYNLDITENTCLNGSATYTVVPDCENGEQFLVEVDVTSLGSATSVSVSDDQGSEPQVLTEVGTVTFGPFGNGTPVIFTVVNDQDESCVLTSPAMNLAVCPPSNDTCAGAIDLANEESPLESTTVGSTNTNATVCNNSDEEVANTYGDTYYSILVPSGSTLTIGQTANNYDSANVVFYGDCDNRTNIACFDDDDYTTVEWSNDTGADQTVYWIQDGWSGTGTFTLEWSVYACTPSEATYTVVSDCANGEQFLVEVEITNLGSATSVSVSDDQGSEPQVVTEVGTVTFGPFGNGTPVIFTVVNDQDPNCTLTSPALNQAVCPPSNDTCANAIDLTNEESPLSSTTEGATNDNATVCNNSDEEVANIYGDTYYSISVPSGSTLTIGQTVNNYDSAIVVFYGDCDNRTGIACFDDGDYTTVEWSNDTGVDQTVYWIQDGWSGTGTFTLEWSVIACTPAEATYTVVSDCANGEQFLVEVDVANLGSATSLTVSDDQGSEPQAVTEVGTVTFGPFGNGTPVIITVVNDQDANCTLISPELNQVACPPVNDNCINALEIIAGGAYGDQLYDSTNVAATGSPQPTPATCFGYSGGDVWYTVQVPASGNITIETGDSSTDESGIDTVVTVYSGTCDALIQVGCDDDGADTGAYSKLTVTDQNPGDILYLRVYEYNNDNFGEFGVSAYDASLNSESFDKNSFKFYPNPVKDILNLSYVQNISNVEVFNLLGQQVVAKNINANTGQIDMSALPDGTYLVKVMAENQHITLKVIKK